MRGNAGLVETRQVSASLPAAYSTARMPPDVDDGKIELSTAVNPIHNSSDAVAEAPLPPPITDEDGGDEVTGVASGTDTAVAVDGEASQLTTTAAALVPPPQEQHLTHHDEEDEVRSVSFVVKRWLRAKTERGKINKRQKEGRGR